MRKTLFLFIPMVAVCFGLASQPAYYYNITFTTSSGQTIYLYSSNNSTARVVAPIFIDAIPGIYPEEVHTYTVTGNFSSMSKPKPTGDLVIPSSITADNGLTFTITGIDSYAFTDCTGLESVTIPSSVTYIGSNAFNNCTGLQSIYIPSSVTSFGTDIFNGCTNLNSPFYTDSIFLFLPYSYSGAYAIPNGIQTVVGGAFSNRNNLSEITIPSTVTFIPAYTFSDCASLATVNFNAENLIMDSYSPFAGSTSIVTFNFGDGVSRIPDGLCQGLTHLENFTYGSGLVTIGLSAFANTGIRSVVIPASVDTIGYGAFANDSMSVYYNGTMEQWCDIVIGRRAFSTYRYSGGEYNGTGYDLYIQGDLQRDLVIPETITSLENHSFVGCNLTSVVIPNHVTSLDAAIYDCPILESVTLGNGITTLYDDFGGCGSLQEVTIGSGMTLIAEYAFNYCTSLNSITCLNPTAPMLEDGPFYGVSHDIPVNIPCGSTPSYLSRWSYFSNFVEMSGYNFEALSADETKGTVQILTAPTCTAPTAVIYANANSGYQFDRWSDGNTENPRTLTVVSDTTIVGYFVSENAVDLAGNDNVLITVSQKRITVSGTAGERIRLFDSFGRQLAVCERASDVQTFAVPAIGTYLIQVNNNPARKVVVVK